MSSHCPTCGAADDGTVNGWVHRAQAVEARLNALTPNPLAARVHALIAPSCVLQDWVQQIPWKQQSILISGLRGPDSSICPMVRRVVRWMRRVSQHNADPSKDYMKLAAQPDVNAVTDELEYLPCHFVHHFADAVRVIGINHPNADERTYANDLHEHIAEEIFHFIAEPPEVFVQRHRDKAALEAALAAALAPHPEPLTTEFQCANCRQWFTLGSPHAGGPCPARLDACHQLVRVQAAPHPEKAE